jgi:hypothetical protein
MRIANFMTTGKFAIRNSQFEINFMETLIKDLRYGIRSFLKRPGFLFMAVSTLALGIGGATAMFTVVNSVLLRPLQFPQPEQIVLFEGINPQC